MLTIGYYSVQVTNKLIGPTCTLSVRGNRRRSICIKQK